MKNIIITEHAYLRLKERNGWSRETADRMIGKIYMQGKKPSDTPGYIGTWLRERIAKSNRSCNQEYLVYGKQIYIFIDNKLITVLTQPRKNRNYTSREPYEPVSLMADYGPTSSSKEISRRLTRSIIYPRGASKYERERKWTAQEAQIHTVIEEEPPEIKEKKARVISRVYNPQYSSIIKGQKNNSRKIDKSTNVLKKRGI